ncbi:cytochrome P450 [Lobosporangium transversale]|uniref:Cytochrome P450 n=1 Tax=Lobosporangium transversale TaxID=64571 RepID=A0A1Y2GTX0_9FUNG|nr:cytochrome P450 [Lobosporangium transversale]ORZ23676.1 cytochrome P450 [Lobosporangium transversale]|eukprot:XP_021883490.1 cytochrome P450 [Lobosporangium transversale]
MHTNLVLGTTVAAAAIGYFFKPKKPKTELEVNSVPIPTVPSYLPLQVDSLLKYIFSVYAEKDEFEYLRHLSAQYGNTLNFRGFNEDLIIVLDPSSIQHILAKNQPNYEKGAEFQAIFHDFLGNGIFNADGETWKIQRHLARPHFQTSEFRDAALINRHVDELLKVIDKHLASNPEKPIEVQSLFCRFTLDEATEFLFGEAANALQDEDNDFATAFNYTQAITGWRFRVPLWRYVVPTRRFLKEIKKLDDFVYRIVDKGIAREEARTREQEKNPSDDEHGGKGGHENLLDHFLSQRQEYGFDREYLRDMLLNFLLAGRDTTASLLTFTVWELSKHPHVLEKLKREVAEVVASGTAPSYDDIKKLKYQKQVINEVLRLYPPVPYNTRHSVEEDVLPNGYYIPPNTTVAYGAYSTHRLVDLWGDDALEFDPDRWGPERVGKIKPFMFVPFHAGPRICLGQNLAYTTAQVTLTRLLQKYDIKASPGFKPELMADIVLFSRNGVEAVLVKQDLSEI